MISRRRVRASSSVASRLPGAGRRPRQLLRNPVAVHEQMRDRAGRRRPQHDVPAPGTDRRQDVLRCRGAQHPDGPGGRLLETLQQRVGGVLGEPVGVLDHDHLPAPRPGGERGVADQLANLVDADRQALGGDQLDVRVGAGQRGPAGVAGSAAALVALQCRRERPGRVGATGSRWPGEQPGVGHAGAGASGDPVPGRFDRAPQQLDQRLLPDQVGPHRRGGRLRHEAPPCVRATAASIGSSRSRIAAAMASTSWAASTTT
jgi:hypothetical protein